MYSVAVPLLTSAPWCQVPPESLMRAAYPGFPPDELILVTVVPLLGQVTETEMLTPPLEYDGS